MTISFNNLGMPIGTNRSGWEQRLDELIGHFLEDSIGWLQPYIPPYSDEGYNSMDVRKLAEKTLVASKEKDLPLRFVVHGAHSAHNVNMSDGLTPENKDAINSSLEGVAVLGERAAYMIFHAGVIPDMQHLEDDYRMCCDTNGLSMPAELEESIIDALEANIRECFEYLARRRKEIGVSYCKILIENMPERDKHRTVLMAGISSLVSDIAIEAIAKQFGFGLCFDYTHLAVSNMHRIPGRAPTLCAADDFHDPRSRAWAAFGIHDRIYSYFDNSLYWAEVAQFLGHSPKVLHVSGSNPGDIDDVPIYLTGFNHAHLRSAAEYVARVGEEVPIILEVPHTQWNLHSDGHNLELAKHALQSSSPAYQPGDRVV